MYIYIYIHISLTNANILEVAIFYLGTRWHQAKTSRPADVPTRSRPRMSENVGSFSLNINRIL